MRKRNNSFPVFFVFLFLSIILIAISAVTNNVLGNITKPLASFFFNSVNRVFSIGTDKNFQKLKEENLILYNKLANLQNLNKEINALRDQFQTSYPSKEKLVPAKIIGAPAFIPGVNVPETFVIDKGTKDNIKAGSGVVYKHNLVGKVSKITNNRATVILLTNKNFSFSAIASKTKALGVIKGHGNGEMVFDNVMLSENLIISDIVLTKGDVDINGIGLLPDITIGKIISVDKEASSLFQSAKVQSMLDFTKLDTVFVIIQN